MNMRWYLLIVLYTQGLLWCVAFNSTPLRTIHTLNSILDHKELYPSVSIGNRSRLATCTAAAWFHENYLAVLNYLGQHITTYLFDRTTQQFTLIQQVTSNDGAQLYSGIHMTVSPDGQWLAVCSEQPANINLYRIDTNSHLICPIPSAIHKLKNLVHNVRFSPDGHYLACASYDTQHALQVYRVHTHAHTIHLQLVYNEANDSRFKTKVINFSHDQRYVFVGYGISLAHTNTRPYESVLTIRTFDSTHGTIGNLVCTIGKQPYAIEDMNFIDGDHTMIISDQGTDSLRFYSFDTTTGIINTDSIVITGVHTKLRFPHGISVCPYEQYLVVTNLENDTFNLYAFKDEILAHA